MKEDEIKSLLSRSLFKEITRDCQDSLSTYSCFSAFRTMKTIKSIESLIREKTSKAISSYVNFSFFFFF